MLSFVAGVFLFEFHITLSFVVGTALVVGSTFLFSRPDASPHGVPLPQPASSKSATPPAVHYAVQQPFYQGSPSPILRSRTSSPTRGLGIGGPYRRSPTTGHITPDLGKTSFENIEAHTVEMPVAEDEQYAYGSDARSLANGFETRKPYPGAVSPVP